MRVIGFLCLVVPAACQDLFLAPKDLSPQQAGRANSKVPYIHHFPEERQPVIHRILGESYVASVVSAPETRTFQPQNFGGDPTGKADSSDAIDKTIAAMIDGAVDVGTKYLDLGGARLDLAGGNFAIGRPIVFPKGYKNFQIVGGTLSAMHGKFPANRTLLQLGDAAAAKGAAGMSIDISHVTLDGAGIVNTALAILNVQYSNVGPAVMVFGFTDFGIKTDGSGGGYIHKAWLGQAAPDHRQWLSGSPATLPTATAISLENNQHDWYVEDVIVWSARVGLRSQNGANQIQGVHTWNLMTTSGGIGIILERGGGKVIDSYLDFCPLVIVDPMNVVVTNNLFLAKANLVLQQASRGTVQSLVVSNNRWSSEGKYTNDTIILDGKFTSVDDTVIEGNVADSKWHVKSTRATKTVEAQNSTSVTLDFTDDLLFDLAITEVSCTVQAWQFVDHVVHPPTDRTITVVLSKPLSKGKVMCSVDQSSRTHAAH